MGFSITYRTTREVAAAEEAQIRAAADKLTDGYTWLSCEPVTFYRELDEGRLAGFCKPNFMPHPDDIASALREGLPDGTVNEMLDVLCELSRRFRIDFELEHDESNGVAGYIRQGECEEDLRGLISAFGSLAEFSLDHALGEMGHEIDDEDFDDPDDNDDDDRDPPIIKFPGR
jgi:hypothetical protein